MKKILLFGAGKSATVLIDYLLKNALAENWTLTLVDASLAVASGKIGQALGGKAVAFDINDGEKRNKVIAESDLVISLLPPALHYLVAQDCLSYKKHLLTASYVDEKMRSMQEDIQKAGLLFLCEMGLDPGIDHMSAKKMIDEIHAEGGTITSFYSHCGGLVAPESDDNPWRYKISWNPRNVVLAGKAGAVLKEAGKTKTLTYEQLFAQRKFVSIPGHESLCWYPNRDSLGYIPLYGLEGTPTFIRTTLRHPDFMYGWKNIIDLKLTDETVRYDTDGRSLKDFFREHLEHNGFHDWLKTKMQEQFQASKKILEGLVNLVQLEEKVEETGKDRVEEFMMVSENGNLEKVDMEDLKTNAAATVADKMHEAKLTLKQLFFLGLDDEKTLINKGRCSAADVLQFALEKKLSLRPGEKDLVVMKHEIGFTVQDRNYIESATLLLTGENEYHTAMAKTVGLPLGIAAKLILNGTISSRGLLIPVSSDIYLPVLAELEKQGVSFREERQELPR